MERQRNNPFPSVSVSQDDIGSNEEMFEIWRVSVAPYFQCNPLSSFTKGLKQSITQINAGKFLYTDVTMAAQQYKRSNTTHRDFGETDHILLETFETSYNCTRNGSTEFIENGGVATIDLSQQVESFCSENAKNSLFVLPRQWLQENVPSLVLEKGLIFERNSINERLFKDFMKSVKKQLLVADVKESSVIADSILAMLDVLSLKSDFDASESIDANVKVSIKKYINQNLGNLWLTAGKICDQFFMSRSTLYRLFKEEGGVANVIKENRLEACFKALHDPVNTEKSVAEIALACGLPNSNYLSSQFRDKYDITPRQIREKQREAEWSEKYRIPPDKSAEQVISNMASWARSLK